MRYLSICSGIEAASVAWHQLGWQPLAFSEIEPFPRAVLGHHYPDVPLHGDFTALREQPWIVDADVLVGGTPCQAFSVAGLRKSLDDDRGNLSLEFVRLADAIDDLRLAAGRDPAVIVWENVPGVLSVKDNAFGCLLAGLAGDVTPYDPPRGKWTDAGVVAGPARAVAWRVLDAQYFGLAQRRRRVFVVASAREGFDPAAVLLEFEGVRRDTPPRREAGKGFTHELAPSLTSSGRGVERGGDTRGQDPVVAVPHWRAGDQANSELLTDMAGTLNCNKGQQGRILFDVAHSLRGEGFDASEDGTGRGTPLVPIAFSAKDHGADAKEDLSPTLRAMNHHGSHANGGGQMAVAVSLSERLKGRKPVECSFAEEFGTPVYPVQEVGKRTGVSTDDPRAGIGIGTDGDPMYTLQAGAQHGVAYPLDLRNAGRDPDKRDEQNRQGLGIGEDGDPSPTISTAFVPGVAAYAFQPRIARNGHGDTGDIVNALNAESGETGKGDAAPCVAVATDVFNGTITGEVAATMGTRGSSQNSSGPTVMQHMAVRRLTPVECERLQGFPDNYTLIPWRNKSATDCPDGPRYKALGNSMAVPCMHWIGRRIAEVLE